MIEYKEGDKVNRICPYCGKVDIVFKYSSYLHGTEAVTNVLLGFCVKCTVRLVVPAQSTPAISHLFYKSVMA